MNIRTINCRNLHPGHIVVFDDGALTVSSAEFGSGLAGGPDLKTARAIDVKFSNGGVVHVHPDLSVKIKSL